MDKLLKYLAGKSIAAYVDYMGRLVVHVPNPTVTLEAWVEAIHKDIALAAVHKNISIVGYGAARKEVSGYKGAVFWVEFTVN